MPAIRTGEEVFGDVERPVVVELSADPPLAATRRLVFRVRGLEPTAELRESVVDSDHQLLLR
jgi:hypothetical protein